MKINLNIVSLLTLDRIILYLSRFPFQLEFFANFFFTDKFYL